MDHGLSDRWATLKPYAENILRRDYAFYVEFAIRYAWNCTRTSFRVAEPPRWDWRSGLRGHHVSRGIVGFLEAGAEAKWQCVTVTRRLHWAPAN
jgi:hypothetical protein